MARDTPGRPRSASREPAQDASNSWATSPAVRRRMQAQRTRDTGPEMAVRRILHAAGLRYRIDTPPLPGLRRRADVVFRNLRIAVFVDGCFWHGCPIHGNRKAGLNATYWDEKIASNRIRDMDTDAALVAAAWTVLRFWEHDDPGEVAAVVIAEVRARQAPSPR